MGWGPRTVAGDVEGFVLGAVLSDGQHHVVARATAPDGAPVVVKLLKEDHATGSAIERLEHEHALLRLAAGPRLIGVRELLAHRGTRALVLEDVGARPLADLAGTLSPARATVVAIGAAQALADLHAHGVVHHDVAPGNVLVAADGRVLLCDLGLSTRVREEEVAAAPTTRLRGTLPFLSPEQTGRAGRPVDVRSDLYALGATLFALVAGRPPFAADDALGFVHAHLALAPPRLRELVPEASPALEAIVARLLAKAPEDRYASAVGVVADLRLAAEGRTGFPLARHDVPDRLRLSGALFGRDAELARLGRSIAAAGSGGVRTVAVRGPSGVGKTALVAEACRQGPSPAASRITGKFDQYRRDVPFGALGAALDRHVRLLLGEEEDHLRALRGQLRDGLGADAGALTALVPAARHLLDLPAPGGAPPVDARAQVHRALRAFLTALGGPGEPVVVVLDDLQWADTASLALLADLARDDVLEHVLLVLAYRDDEVGPNHPLARTLDELDVEDVPLAPLTERDLTAWLAASLRRAPADVAPLAAVVGHKTAGNPFFVGRFVAHLAQRGWLHFDGGWRWDLDAIAAADLTDNVVTLLVARLRELPEATRRALSHAAILGGEFTLGDVRALLGEEDVPLEPALEQSFVVGVGEGRLRFVHDRIQEAARSLLDPEVARELNWRYAHEWLRATGDADAIAFELAAHLERGLPADPTERERALVADVQLRAAVRARAAGASEAAFAYALAGLALLGEDRWTLAPDLTRALTQQAQSSGRAVAAHEVAEQRYAELVEHVDDVLELVDAHGLMVEQHLFLQRYEASVQLALDVLAQLGAPVDQATLWDEIQEHIAAFAAWRADHDLDELLDRPPAADPYVRAQLSLMKEAAAPAFFLNPLLALLFGARSARILIEHGTGRGIGYLLAAFQFAEWLQHNDPLATARIGELGVQLARRTGDREAEGLALTIVAVFNVHWQRPARDAIAVAHQAFELLSADETRNLRDRTTTFVASGTAALHGGGPLSAALAEAERALDFRVRHGNDHGAAHFYGDRQLVHALTGVSSTPTLEGDGITPEAERWWAGTTPGVNLVLACHRLTLAVVFGDDAAAWEHAQVARELLPYTPGSLGWALFHFHEALVACRVGELDRAEEDLALLRRWAEVVPVNFEHQRLLVEAELDRARGGGSPAQYEAAIAAAGAAGVPAAEALACERAAAWCAERGLAVAADAYLARAATTYARWGAEAKAAQLRPPTPGAAGTRSSGTSGTWISTDAEIDVAAVLRAVDVLGGDLDAGRVTASLVEVALENAGADRGVVLVHEDGVLTPAVGGEATGGRIAVRECGDQAPGFARSVVDYVRRTQERVVLDDPARDAAFGHDPWLTATAPRAVLAQPVARDGRLVAVLYLENAQLGGVFAEHDVRALEFVAGQAALALENARLHGDLEARIARRTAQLGEANRRLAAAVQARDTFLATMSHEIRTPMNAVIGMTSLLAGTSLDAGQRELVDTVRASGEHLLTVINDILDFSKIEAEMLELEELVFDPRACAEEALDLLAARAAEKDLDLCLDVPDDVPAAVLGDPGRVRQVLLNLVGNAVKFTEAGEVVVTLRAAPAGDGRERLELAVRDTGPGIPADRMDRLFRAFSQVDASIARRYAGTGLGLVISRRLAELMDGAITVETVEGAGSTFTFTFLAGRAAAPEPADAAAVDLRGRRVLVAERRPATRRVLTTQLRALGADVIDDGACDLALADELGRAVALRRDRGVPVVLVAPAAERAAAAGAGLDATIGRPVRRAALVAALARVLAPATPSDRVRATEDHGEEELPALRVLVAEDNATNRRVAQLLLRKLGQDCDLVADGLEAVEAVRARQYDVVFMDVQMPELDGLSATRRIRAELPADHQPFIVAMTANVLHEDRDEALAAGMDDFIPKPIRAPALRAALLRH